jgi:LacI family transcriptional regulator
MKYTRDDIARMARVSTATVSRVYNNPDIVSKEKARRVLAAAKKVGYSPDKNASALRRSGTGTILFLEKPATHETLDKRFYYWHYADVLKAVKEVTDEHAYQLSLYTVSSPRDISAIKRRNLCDGIIVYDIGDRETMERIRDLGLPYVCCGSVDRLEGFNRCYVDQHHGGYLAADQFLRTGHTKPAHITAGFQWARVCRQRWEGFREGFGDTEPKLIAGRDLGVQWGQEAARQAAPLIRKGRIDSIFVVNDLTAVGVVQGLLERKIRIPEQVSVIGFDNLPFIAMLPLKLATIDINMGETYREAARLLMKSMRDSSAIERTIEPFFVDGESITER